MVLSRYYSHNKENMNFLRKFIFILVDLFPLIIITGVSLIEEGGSHCFGKNIKTCISPAVFIAEGITKVNIDR